MTIETITAFLGWCAVINLGVLVVSASILVGFRKKIAAVHGKMFGLDENELSKVYMTSLAHYEIAIVVLNIVLYIVLKIMG